MKTKKLSICVMLIVLLSLSGCTTDEAVSTIQDDVKELGLGPQIAQLGQEIADYQRAEVWRGGNPSVGCYTWEDREKFLADDELADITQSALQNKEFMEGIIALKSLEDTTQWRLMKKLKEPIDPTWAQMEPVSQMDSITWYSYNNGTTDAGQETEKDIAEALVDLIQKQLPESEKDIEKTWLDNLSWTTRSWKKLWGNAHLIDEE